MPPPPTFDVRLARARMLAPNVRELGFERVGRRAVRVPGGPVGEPRPAARGGRGTTRLLDRVRAGRHAGLRGGGHEGRGRPRLDLPARATGRRDLRAIGPQGFFTRPRGAGHPTLFVGTGTGVTPLRSMIKDALAAGETTPDAPPVRRAPRDRSPLPRRARRARGAASELPCILHPLAARRRLAGAHAATCRRTSSRCGASSRRRAPGAPHVYICGLERMVGAVRDLLRKQMGVDRKQVHSERYD